MTSIMAPWPFYQWGMDILGPLPLATRRVKFVIVAIDYFTKWIEAKPLARITGKEVIRDAVILVEIGMLNYQNMMIKEGFNEEELRLNLDLLQERREMAAIWEARCKTKLEQYYNKRVHLTSFKPGEFVFRKNEASRVKHIRMALTSCKLWKTKRCLRLGMQSIFASAICRNYCFKNSKALYETKILMNAKFLFLSFRKGNAEVHSTRRHDLPKRLGLKGEAEVHSTGRNDLPKRLSLKGEANVHSIERHDLPKILSLKGKTEVHSSGRHDLPKRLSLKGEAEVHSSGRHDLPKRLSLKGEAEVHGTERHDQPKNKVKGNAPRCTMPKGAIPFIKAIKHRYLIHKHKKAQGLNKYEIFECQQPISTCIYIVSTN
ncbi:reverse transcriptase domain-containing protein [Tanacetum coccineum]